MLLVDDDSGVFYPNIIPVCPRVTGGVNADRPKKISYTVPCTFEGNAKNIDYDTYESMYATTKVSGQKGTPQKKANKPDHLQSGRNTVLNCTVGRRESRESAENGALVPSYYR